jgi:hypothetical protein
LTIYQVFLTPKRFLPDVETGPGVMIVPLTVQNKKKQGEVSCQ